MGWTGWLTGWNTGEGAGTTTGVERDMIAYTKPPDDTAPSAKTATMRAAAPGWRGITTVVAVVCIANYTDPNIGSVTPGTSRREAH